MDYKPADIPQTLARNPLRLIGPPHGHNRGIRPLIPWEGKPLSTLPVLGVTPPLPLAQRRMLHVEEPRKSSYKGKTSWPEDRINTFRKENEILRQQISRQIRKEEDSNRRIALLKQQNTYYLQKINWQTEKVAQIAKSVATAFWEYQGYEWDDSDEE